MKCPVCGEHHRHLINKFNQPTDWLLLSELSQEVPGWMPEQGVCSRCLDSVQVDCLVRLQEDWKGLGAPGEVDGYQILPTPVRLSTDPSLTGRDVTICLIDSGFYPHPDLVLPDNRILEILDITQPDRNKDYFQHPNSNAWHGTMTSVVCAGNGYLSHGKYKGIASNARLVLLKVTDESGKITAENIAAAIDWAINHRETYQIRIINLSVTGDEPESWHDSLVSQKQA